jgi:pyroglutamyl-peptidase
MYLKKCEEMKLNKIVIAFCFSFLFIGFSVTSGLSFENTNNNNELNATTVLVTGFGPWLDYYNPNPAQLIAQNLSGKEINGATIVGIVIPAIWDKALEIVIHAIEDYDPDIVVSLGADLRGSIRVERLGRNIKSSKYPDNQGTVYLLRIIERWSPFFRFSNLPSKQIAEEISNAGISAKQSLFAGRFICNQILYGVTSFVKRNNLPIIAGFIHVPLQPEQDPENGMELEKSIEAIEIAISVCLEEL